MNHFALLSSNRLSFQLTIRRHRLNLNQSHSQNRSQSRCQPSDDSAGLHLANRRLSGVAVGRYRTEMIEDERYYWTVSRYVHLNPVRAGLVKRPEQWAWSSYPGYAHRGRRLEWVAYDELLVSWEGEFGGSDAAATYRRLSWQTSARSTRSRLSAAVAFPPRTSVSLASNRPSRSALATHWADG